MQLNRDKIKRMINQLGGTGSGARGGGDGTDITAWVNANFVSKAFFSALFKVLDGTGSSATEIEPNDTETIADNPNTVNIQALFGLWTEQYLTALGQGTGGGGGGGGATTLAQLTDVQLTALDTGNLLKYDGTHWINVTLASLLSGYATETWVGNNFALATDNATKTWVNNQGFVKSHPTSIWGQNWPSTNTPIKGNMLDVGNITMDDGDRYIYFGNSNQNFYIKKISDRFIIKSNGTEVVNIYSNQFYAAVQIRTTVGLLSDGYVTALSDIRKKNVIDLFAIDIEKIAAASLIHFTWKDRDGKTAHVGGIAQEWQKILPEAVVESEDGTLAMDYGVIGMASAVSIARKVQDQQREIEELKAKNANLEERLARIEKLLMEGRI